MSLIPRGVSLLGLAALAGGAHASTVYDVVLGSSSYVTLQVYTASGTLFASGTNNILLDRALRGFG